MWFGFQQFTLMAWFFHKTSQKQRMPFLVKLCEKNMPDFQRFFILMSKSLAPPSSPNSFDSMRLRMLLMLLAEMWVR